MASNSGAGGGVGPSEGPDVPRTEPDTSSPATSWQLAAVVQFCQLFGQALKIKPPSADELGRALQEPAGSTPIISDLVFKLLSPVGAQPPGEEEVEGWQDLLQHKLSSCWSLSFKANPLEGKDFIGASPQTRAEVLFALCEWRVSDSAVLDVIKATAKAVDVPPGAPGSGSPEGNSLLEGLKHYAARLGNSQGSYERAMHDFLAARVLPKLEGPAAAKQGGGSGEAALPEEKPANHVQEQQAAEGEPTAVADALGGGKGPEEAAAAPGADNPGHEASPAAAAGPPEGEPGGGQPGSQEASLPLQGPPGEGSAGPGAQVGEGAAAEPAPEEEPAAVEPAPAPAAAPGEEPAPTARCALPAPMEEPAAAEPPPPVLFKQEPALAQPPPAALPPKQEPGSDAGPPSASRPMRSSRMTAPRKYQDGEPDSEEEGHEPPAPKRAKQEHPAVVGAAAAGPPLRPPPGHALHRPMHTGMPGAFPPRIARPTPAPMPPPPPLYRALYPSALDVPVPRRRRSAKRRFPRSTRASMNRLKQAAHGTLPLGIKREARASVYVLAAGGSPEASASESEDMGEEEEDDESSSEYSDSELEEERPRGKGRGRGRPAGSGRQQQDQRQQAPGSMGQQQQQRPMYQQGQGMQISAAQQAQLQAILAQTPPHMRPVIMQRFMQQLQAQQLQAQQAQQLQAQQAQQLQAQQAQAQQQQQVAAAQAQARAGGAPHFSQLPREQQQAIAAQFLAQLPPQQQMAVRQLSQEQLVNLLQNYWQQRVGGAVVQQPQQPQQQAQMGSGPAGVPQQQFGGGMGGGGGPPPGAVSDQARLALVVNQLAPEVRAQLQAMPGDQQRAVLQNLLQRHQMEEQQRMMLQQQQSAATGGMMGGSGMGMHGMGQMQGGPRPQAQPQQGSAGGRSGGEEKVDVNWFLNDS